MLARRKKLLIYGIPLITGLLGLATLFAVQWRLEGEINREKARLLAVGIDVSRLTDKDDAYDDYLAAEQAIESNASDLEILRRLEIAGSKRTVRLGHRSSDLSLEESQKGPDVTSLLSIDNWRSGAMNKWYSTQQWDLLERLFEVDARLKIQTFADGGARNVLPLYDLPLNSATARSWMRDRLERLASVYYRSALGRFGRQALEREPSQATMYPAADPFWVTLIERQRLFRLSADLRTIRIVSEICEDALPVGQAKMDLNGDLYSRLKADPSWPSQWAARRAMPRVDVMLGEDTMPALNLKLIELDLRESSDRDKPMVPTWSKRYCVNPTTGDKITIGNTTKRGFVAGCGVGAAWILW